MAELSYFVASPNEDLSDWDEFVSRSPQGALFCKSWWLRAAFPDHFEVLVAKRSGTIVAGIPLPYSVSGRRKRFIRPPMTTTMGILLGDPRSSTGTYEKRLSDEMNLLSGLVAAIPNNAGFRVAFHPTFQNWLPFYWQGYRQTTAYTYVLDNINDIDAVISGMDHSKRKNLQKAKKILSVDRSMSAESFYRHHKMTLQKEGKVISYDPDYLSRIALAARAHANIQLLAAVEPSGAIHSAIVVLYDRVSAYYILSSIDPDYRNSGSATLLLIDAMRIASDATNRFDFEGSMIQGVERSFRKFGARQTPFFVIYKEEGWRPKVQIALERVARKMGIKE
ncbi:MAG: hypothetical protein JXA57_19040 [Armatimonadetes bacterium]|nr:hypothetical protein [Armatimonadota bacterium]